MFKNGIFYSGKSFMFIMSARECQDVLNFLGGFVAGVLVTALLIKGFLI
jgi:hypothetical protein